MQEISAEALHQWLEDPARRKPFLLDVREPWEFERCHIEGSELIPMREIRTGSRCSTRVAIS